jgi:hypothetical protein
MITDSNGNVFSVDDKEDGFSFGSIYFFVALTNGIMFLKQQTAGTISRGDYSEGTLRQAAALKLLHESIQFHLKVLNLKPGDPVCLAQFLKTIKNKPTGEKQLIYLAISAIGDDFSNQALALEELRQDLLKDEDLAALQAKIDESNAMASADPLEGLNLATEKLESLVNESQAKKGN